MQKRTRPVRRAMIGAPAAVIGTLAAVLTGSPAEATEPPLLSADTGSLPANMARPLPGTTAAVSAAAAHAHAAVQPMTATASSYTVQPGDTVAAIAARHGLRTVDVLAWNGLGWRSVIHPGQSLRLSTGTQAAPAPAPARAAAAVTHTVMPGDTVYAIAKRYRTTVSSILSENRLPGSAMIHPGQTLRIAGTAATPAAPAAPATPAAPAPAPAPAAAATAHTVAAGDTLSAIAKKHATTVGALMSANGLSEGSIIYPGQTLRLAPATPGQRWANLDAAQVENARHIIRVGRELGVPDRGIAIALATAMVESSLHNLDHGDRDSLGLFQQRPSQGWGSPAQILNADRSIRVFYGGAHDPNGAKTHGLLDVPGWQARDFTDAAQAVQISAFPERYGEWEQQSNRWLATL